MKRVIAVILALVMVLVLVACGGRNNQAGNSSGNASSSTSKGTGAPKTENYRLALGTSTTGSTYYILGTGWANIMQEKVPGVEMSIEATPGGITNMQSMRSGDMDLGMTTCWLAGDGWNGTAWADGTKYDNCRSLFPTHSSVMYIFTLADSGIETIQDCEGKRIGCGAAGSTSGDGAPLLFEALGITPASYTGLSSTGTCDALKDGTIDVGVGVTGVPASWLLDLETTKDIRLIPLSDEDLAAVLKEQPYWAKGAIPGGVYKNHEEDIPCIAYWNMIIANESLSEDLVYNLCKATYESIDELAEVDQNARSIDTQYLDTMTMPLHPGAVRYYKEIGVDIPDLLLG